MFEIDNQLGSFKEDIKMNQYQEKSYPTFLEI